jgi:tRNA dimethylallyltransferase
MKVEPQSRIFVVQGPTASGKTSLAISLAQHFSCEIISADSRQFYKELRIGTAVPSQVELAAAPHHFIQSHSIASPLSAAAFAKEAQPVLEALLKKDGAVVVVGGSGLFVDALLIGLDDLPHDAAVQQKWQQVFEEKGLLALQNALQKNDPLFYELIDRQNPLRLIRALEIHELSGKSNLELRQGPKYDPKNVSRLFIDWPREELYKRIEQRVDLMFAAGLEEEVRKFYPTQLHLKALQTVGYQEFFEAWEGKFAPELVADKIKQHTRNYAKRQLTWMRRYASCLRIDPLASASFLQQVLSELG